MTTKKTATIRFETKEPDGWQNLLEELDVPDTVSDPLIEFGECATVELEFDSELKVVSGRLVPFR